MKHIMLSVVIAFAAVFSCVIPSHAEDGAISNTDARALFEKANSIWNDKEKGLNEISEVIKICEQLLEKRDYLQASEDGKLLLGKTYYLIGLAYNAKNDTIAATSKGPRTGTVKKLKLKDGVFIDMIYCEPGEFIMGSPYEEEGRDADEIQHRVTLTHGFWMSKCEVTQRQWESVTGKNPSTFKGNASLPVDNISWNNCKDFVRKLNKRVDCGARLPTEAEWEYACRAGTKTAFFWGNSLNGRRANCNGDFPCATRERGPYLRRPTVAGQYAPNPWGFFDMHGNMYEWCEDKCCDYTSEDVTDPIGDMYGKCRVLRGGCWYFGARFCRSANRIKNNPSYADAFTGMRLCCDRIPDETKE